MKTYMVTYTVYGGREGDYMTDSYRAKNDAAARSQACAKVREAASARNQDGATIFSVWRYTRDGWTCVD